MHLNTLHRISILSRPSFHRIMNENFKKYEYIKKCNKQDSCLPNAWIVVRLDGRNFTRFTDIHNFVKPNDLRALELMNRAAAKVMEELEDICLAYGESDEYSFVFKKNTSIFNRDSYAINSAVNSLFTAAYVYYWNHFFAFKKLWCLPGFDGRVVIYPTDENLRDYLSWRQADTHINNLYNTVFWALVSKGNHDRRKAQEILRGTVSREKNDILFKDYGINYNNEPQLFRKGTTLIRKLARCSDDDKLQQHILLLNCDIIGNKFWNENPEILNSQSPQIYDIPERMPHYTVNGSYIISNTVEEESHARMKC